MRWRVTPAKDARTTGRFTDFILSPKRVAAPVAGEAGDGILPGGLARLPGQTASAQNRHGQQRIPERQKSQWNGLEQWRHGF
jgi:hypothetical protein